MGYWVGTCGGVAMALEVRKLVKNFAGVQAVADVSFSVAPGECVALIGPNGAGKSTTFGCIAGQHRADSGTVFWNGQPVQHNTASERLLAGIARTFQVAQVFEALTVLQNLQLAKQARTRLPMANVLSAQDPQVALQLLGLLGLESAAQTIAGSLPYGAKKRLELGIALAGISAGSQHRPHLLLLDEPAAGLAADERASLMALVKSLVKSPEIAGAKQTDAGANASNAGALQTEAGAQQSDAAARGRLFAFGQGDTALAVLYTEHNMDAVFGVADRVLVLMDGRIVAQGTPADVAASAIVRQRYLGQGFAFNEGAPHA